MNPIIFIVILLIFTGTGHARVQDKETVKGRAQVVIYEKCLEISLFLVNTTDKEVEVITGLDRNPKSAIKPTFFIAGGSCSPSRISFPTTAAQRPIHKLSLKPKKDIMIGSYIILRPQRYTKASRIEPQLYLRTEDRDLEFIVSFEKIEIVEQDSADQPATAPESKSEGEEKPKPESRVLSQ